LIDPPVPNHVRYSLLISTAFVVMVTVKSWTDPVQQHLWADPELLNAVGQWTIPACFVVIVYFVLRYYSMIETDRINNSII